MRMGWLAKTAGFLVLSAAPLLVAIPAVGREDASESVAATHGSNYIATVLDRKGGSLTLQKEGGEVEIFSLDDAGLTLRNERSGEKGSATEPLTKTSFALHHRDIAFEEFEYGIYKRRLLEDKNGVPIDNSDWRVGHPVLFPTTLCVGQAGGLWKMYAFQIRVPIDDVTTQHYWYTAFVPPEGAQVPSYMLDRVESFDFIYKNDDGSFKVELIDGKDIMAGCSPGPIFDRTVERLSWSDRGLIAYRKMLARELENVAAGRDPIGTIRDAVKNEIIEFPIEHGRQCSSEDGFASIGAARVELTTRTPMSSSRSLANRRGNAFPRASEPRSATCNGFSASPPRLLRASRCCSARAPGRPTPRHWYSR